MFLSIDLDPYVLLQLPGSWLTSAKRQRTPAWNAAARTPRIVANAAGVHGENIGNSRQEIER